jgi:RNA polymerase sigma-70 factor, ECF subfamily
MATFHATHIDKNPDGALLAATKRGDAHACEELVLRYKRRVFAAALRITKNREDSEDVVQESFHKAFLHLDEFQEKSRFSTWLTRIAMNEAIMLLRRRRRALEALPERSDNDVEPVSATFVDQKPNPEQSCWQRERTELLTEAINRLRPKIRRTIVLCDIEERSAKETAQILGTSISAVKSRVSRGHQELRATVKPGLLREVYVAGSTEAQRC